MKSATNSGMALACTNPDSRAPPFEKFTSLHPWPPVPSLKSTMHMAPDNLRRHRRMELPLRSLVEHDLFPKAGFHFSDHALA
jgi:hypothetical protein